MIAFVLSFPGGALTLFSPCILPVVPFVFARVDRPFATSGLPLLVGMASTFAGVATLGAVAGGWATPCAGPILGLEQRLVERLRLPAAASAAVVLPAAAPPTEAAFVKVAAPAQPRLSLADEGPLPPLDGAVQWLNGPPLTAEALRGKVVLIDFWTFGCVNCRNALPHVREWQQKYGDKGLVVIGVHAPESAYEKNVDNVKRALADLGVSFPVAVDNDLQIWRAFHNTYWPALYLVDAKGRIRFHHFGEGAHETQDQVIRQLLDDARKESTAS